MNLQRAYEAAVGAKMAVDSGAVPPEKELAMWRAMNSELIKAAAPYCYPVDGNDIIALVVRLSAV